MKAYLIWSISPSGEGKWDNDLFDNLTGIRGFAAFTTEEDALLWINAVSPISNETHTVHPIELPNTPPKEGTQKQWKDRPDSMEEYATKQRLEINRERKEKNA